MKTRWEVHFEAWEVFVQRDRRFVSHFRPREGASSSFDPLSQHRDQVFGFVFTSGSLAKGTVIKLLQDYNADNPRRVWMNVFCDFRKLLVSYECPGGLYPSAMDATYLYCTKDSEVNDLLLLFYCILATFIEEAHVARPNYFSYASIARTDATYHALVPGKGSLNNNIYSRNGAC